MSIGIGGAGSKLASLLDNGQSTIVNVSESEMMKVDAVNRILAVAHSTRGQFRGSGKNPNIGKTAFLSISDEIHSLIKGELVFTSSGGGTGNGITTTLLKKIAERDNITWEDRSVFCFLLPYVNRESSEYVENTISFLMDPVSEAIDSGNTGNMILFSNKVKFEGRIAEANYNNMLINSLRQFLVIPFKNDQMKLLDGHIDHQDFNIYRSKPYFNHFTQFNYDTNRPFGQQLKENFNSLLLRPESAIEALFLLEVPYEEQAPMLYNILDFFSEDDVTPAYSVVHNPELEEPQITVSLLYSRKPRELVDDFKQMADKLTRRKLKKSIEQFVKLETTPLDITKEVKEITRKPPVEQVDPETGETVVVEPEAPQEEEGNDVLSVLRRLKKLR